MLSFVKKYVAHETTWDQRVILVLLILIPLSVRYVFNTPYNFETGAYSDFTSISLYLSDFILTPLLLYKILNERGVFTTWYILLIIWLIFEIFAQSVIPLQILFSIRIIALLTLAISISRLQIVNKPIIAWTVAFLGGLQSLVAIYQFYAQKSLGLYIFGESHLGPDLLGVAKIVAHGTKYIRGYGTFPHPNLLSAFLVIGIAFNLYLLTKYYQKSITIFGSSLLALNIYGLFLTFSRAGIITGLLLIITYCVVWLIKRNLNSLKIAFGISTATVLVSLLLLWPYLLTRTTISDNAVLERRQYNDIGISMIKDNPLFGVGPGMSVLHMEQYSGRDLEPWEVQPIHNYYLITLAEWGIGGMMLILLIVVPIFRQSLTTLKNIFTQTLDYWSLTLTGVGLSILFLFFFDHYFYTIWPTQILLWLMIGFIMKQNNKEPV